MSNFRNQAIDRATLKKLLQTTISLLLFALASQAFAQTIFINDANVYTMGLPPQLQRADVLVRDGRIVEVGKQLQSPADATVIEANGRKVTPGFFAGINALGLEEISLEEPTVDQGLQWDKMRPEFDVTVAYNPQSTSIPVTRIEGYSWAMLGAGRRGSIIGGTGRAVSLDGGYDSFISPPVLFIGLGAATSALTGNTRAAQFMLLNQAMQESRSPVAWAPDVLLTAEGRKVLAGFVTGSGPDGAVVFAADRASDILQVIRFAARENLPAVISSGVEAWKVADELAEAGIPVILDPLENLPANFDRIGARLDNAAILNEAGVTIAFSASDESPHNARKLRQAAGIAVAYGLPYEAGLAGLTSHPARIFRLPEGAGTISMNAPADLVIWSGDPLEVTSRAVNVIIGGKQIPLVSRQTMLRDRYLPQNPEMPRAYIKP